MTPSADSAVNPSQIQSIQMDSLEARDEALQWYQLFEFRGMNSVPKDSLIEILPHCVL